MKRELISPRRALAAMAAGATIILMLSGASCQSNSRDQVLATDQSQLAIRSYQTRAFDTTDQQKTLRAVIATLQDLGFVIDKADLDLGIVSATKLQGYVIRMTVSTRPRGTTQTLVRANAQYEDSPIEDPKPYQQFFAALSKSLFLDAQEVE